MSTEITFKYPEKIILKKQEKLEKRLKKAHKSNKDFVINYYNPINDIQYEIPHIQKFLDSIKNLSLKNEFILLIGTFSDSEIYERFLASIFIYNRIDSLPEDSDKFLYLCIAVEAAMHLDINHNEKKNKLFRDFFKNNLSDESKLKMITSFRNKKMKNIINGPDLVNSRYFGTKPKKKKCEVYLPSCYRQKQCFVYGSQCSPNKLCYLKSEGSYRLNEQLDHILNYLYAKRGSFVHNGVQFALDSKYDDSYHFSCGLWDVYYDYIKNEEMNVIFTLYLEDLFNFYEEALLNFCKGGESH
jgi:hypothetical protein